MDAAATLTGRRFPLTSDWVSDDELGTDVVDALRRSERWAWERAYTLYSRRLMGYLIVRLNSREDAADALSETFVRALNGCGGLRGGPGTFPAWIFRIARNVANDQHRRSRRNAVPEGHETDPPDTSAPGPEALAVSRDEALRVRQAISRLEPADREVLILRLCSGLTSDQVGSVVGKRPGAVRMQQLRALKALADQMGAA